MIDPSTIKKDMPVIASDGERIGEVDGVEGGDHIKLKRNTSPDGQHHFVALTDVDRIDEHVHLNRAAADLRASWVDASGAATTNTAGAGTGAAAAGAREAHVDGERNWLPWILGSLALLALLIFGLRSCDNSEPASVAPVTNDVMEAVPVDTDVAVAVEEQSVTLPGGGTMMIAPRTIGFDLQRYLASTESAPRTFQFERLNFETGSADLRAVDQRTVDGIGQILIAYPSARVRLIGYADARGDADANASLGLSRARSVAAALTTNGVAADRIDTASGGETGATESNATTQGQAENRRTELVVLTK